MKRPYVPPSVLDAAHARSAARAAGNFDEADRLRVDIEAAGWNVIDSGSNFRLEPAHPADLEVDGIVRYGQSDSVPSRLGEPAGADATLVIVVTEDVEQLDRAITRHVEHVPPETQIVLVADGPTPALDRHLRDLPERIEVVCTSARLGLGAAWNVGIRRSVGRIIVVCQPGVEPTGDYVTPIAMALTDPAVAVAGPFGFTSGNLRHFRPIAAGIAATIDGQVLGFRRADAGAFGPVDERFQESAHLDTWWSLVLRDGGPEGPTRRAVVIPGLPVQLQDAAPDSAVEPQAARSAKRNFYRLQAQFRDRTDLAVGDD